MEPDDYEGVLDYWSGQDKGKDFSQEAPCREYDGPPLCSRWRLCPERLLDPRRLRKEQGRLWRAAERTAFRAWRRAWRGRRRHVRDRARRRERR